MQPCTPIYYLLHRVHNAFVVETLVISAATPPENPARMASTDTSGRRRLLLERIHAFCRQQHIMQRSDMRLSTAVPVAQIQLEEKGHGFDQPPVFAAEIGPSARSRFSMGLMDIGARARILKPLCNLHEASAQTSERLEAALRNAGVAPDMGLVGDVFRPPPMYPIASPQYIPNPSTNLFIFNLVGCTVLTVTLYIICEIVRAYMWPKQECDPEVQLPRWLTQPPSAARLRRAAARVRIALSYFARRLARYIPASDRSPS